MNFKMKGDYYARKKLTEVLAPDEVINNNNNNNINKL